MNCLEMEIALMKFFDIKRNIIVPNIYWGMRINHECDLFIISNSGYATEIEIKVSKQDIKKDLEKTHCHFDRKIKYLYFAIPKELNDCIEFIPKDAGILVVWDKRVELRRLPKKIGSYKFTDKEKYKLARLGAMRILGMKEKIQKLRNKRIS